MIAPLHLLTLTDYAQILILSSIIYYFMKWLAKDTQKNLLGYFLIYCASGILFYAAGLTVLADFYLMTWPTIIFLIVSIHQETLQKNFLKIQRYAPTQPIHANWIDQFIKSCLIALHKNKEISCVIERFDHLEPIIKTPSKFYADLDTQLIEILLEKHISSDNQSIWMRHDGKIVAINAYFIAHPDQTWIDTEMSHQPQSIIDATYVTSKTDALVVRVIPFTRSFEIIVGAQMYQNLNAAELSRLFPKLLAASKNKDQSGNHPSPQRHPRATI